jgi:hypothetical protein
MSQTSQRTRRVLRRDWLQAQAIDAQASVSGELVMTFAAYKKSIGWHPQVQKGWEPAKKTQAPHEQGRISL